MVWDSISLEALPSCPEFHIINKNELIAERNVIDILEKYVIPYELLIRN